MRLFLSFLGLFIFYLGIAQSQISATSRFDIQQWDSDRIPVILKINDEFDVSYIQNVGGKVGSQIADIVTLRIDKHAYDELCKMP